MKAEESKAVIDMPSENDANVDIVKKLQDELEAIRSRLAAAEATSADTPSKEVVYYFSDGYDGISTSHGWVLEPDQGTRRVNMKALVESGADIQHLIDSGVIVDSFNS